MCPDHILRGALKRRDVRINGARASSDAPVAPGDRLSVYVDERFLTAPVRVLYRDQRILALEKPQGLPVDADADGIGEDTLLIRARALFPAARLCHRLDAGTGGVVLAALTDEAHARLLGDFKNRRIHKLYQCLIGGHPENRQAELIHHLAKSGAQAKVRTVKPGSPGAMRAALTYRILERRGALSLAEIDLGTGRTHQIRVQMAAAGLPVLGDDKYGDRALNRRYGVYTPALWCTQLTLPDGLTVDSAPAFDFPE